VLEEGDEQVMLIAMVIAGLILVPPVVIVWRQYEGAE
jgi:hypothetical protein